MLGTKIIEEYSSVELSEPVQPLPTNSKGLTARPSKASGLRILTSNEMTRKSTLQVPQGKHRQRPTSSLMASLMTPNSTHTFGVPDPTWSRRPVSSVISLSLSFEERDQKRLSRYSREEDALKSALDSCTTEPIDRDLQIRALEKAISLLKAHAADAYESARQLRNMLADRELEPDAYKSLQKERWMQERRGEARTEEVKALEGMLNQLRASGELVVDPPVANGSKLHTNLLQFFNNSPTKVSFNSTVRQLDETVFRHRTVSDVRSLRLKTTAVVSALKSPIGRLRSKSLVEKGPAYRPGVVPLRRGVSTACDTTTSAVLQPTQPSAPTTMSARVTSPTASVFQAPGFATIIAPAGPRTREELTATISHVGIPSYAQDLFDEFDDIDGDIHLTNMAFQRARSVKRVPVPARPETPPTPPLPVKKSDDPSQRERSASLPHLNNGSRMKTERNVSIRRPISMMFPAATAKGSLDSDSRPSSSLADRDDFAHQGARPSMLHTPTDSNKNRWSLPSGGPKVKSPNKVFQKMKTKFSLLGRK